MAGSNSDMKYCYVLNYVHLFLYILCFICSYYITYASSFCLLSSIFVGWSLYAFVTVGHDCMHKNFTPYSSFNNFFALIFLNGILMPKDLWQMEHRLHHSDPGNENDTMLLDGGTFFTELYHLVKAQKTLTIKENLQKLPLFILLSMLPLYCLPIIWISMIVSFMYLSLTPHITHPHLRQQSQENRLNPKNVAWNIFPKSHLYTFIAGGLNIHACHHENPRWTRSQLMKEANEEYMTINSVKAYLTLLYTR